ncbi:MAG: phage holin family protein, partial [Candidatus Binatia bacterium]
MPQNFPSSQKVSFSRLIGDIITDTKDLFTKELTLARLEMRNELQQTKSAALSLGVGFSILTMGGVLVLLMLTHVLRDFTTLPLWACYGVFGGVCIIGGIVFLQVGSNTA